MAETTVFDCPEYGLTVAELRALAAALERINKIKPAGDVTATVEIASSNWNLRCGYDSTGEFGLLHAAVEGT